MKLALRTRNFVYYVSVLFNAYDANNYAGWPNNCQEFINLLLL